MSMLSRVPAARNLGRYGAQPLIRFQIQRTFAKTAAVAAGAKKLIDAHHYFFDPEKNDFNAFLKPLGLPAYLPDQYQSDFIDPLAAIGVEVEGTVHVEMADDGIGEARWVQSMIDANRCSDVKAIVASCDLGAPDADQKLVELKASSSKVKGVRWILEHEGGEKHIAHKHYNGASYMGGDDGEIDRKFEKGFSLLEKHHLSFDLLCTPAQLPRAAKLFRWHSGVPVCINHLGKPKTLLGDDLTDKDPKPSEEQINIWRRGMFAMSDLPHAYVKLSMLGYAVPGWFRSDEREQVLRDLVYDTVNRFGPDRCMIGSNYHLKDSMADSDGLSDSGPSPAEFYTKLASWFESYSDDERQSLFHDTAKKFYRI